MTKRNNLNPIMAKFTGIAIVFAVLCQNALAHCDTLDGPVVQTARIALEKGDITPLLKMGASR